MTVIDQSDGDEVVMVGTVSYAAEGDMIQATGRMTEHPVYGEQLQIESYELKTRRCRFYGALSGFWSHQGGRRSSGSPDRAPF